MQMAAFLPLLLFSLMQGQNTTDQRIPLHHMSVVSLGTCWAVNGARRHAQPRNWPAVDYARRNDMRRTLFFMIVFLALFIIDCFAQPEVVLEHKLPPGWKYKEFSISLSNSKALLLFQDLSDEILLLNKPPRRLQVLDKDNKLISDFIIDGKYWLSAITSDNRIFLHDGDESGCAHIKAIDLNGNELYEAEAEGRWPIFSGKDIALVPGPMDIGPISIIDGYTGREKFRYSVPAQRNKSFRISSFLPFCEDGFYVVGIGATLFLKSYLHQGERYWKIEDIGGNIEGSKYLNDELIAVSYNQNDFHNK
jgi:hypothetical protein